MKMRFDTKRLPDLGPLLAWARSLMAAAEAGFERLQPYLERLDRALQKHPSLAKAVNTVAAVWRRLVDSFCGTIDPYLERFFPDLRLIGVVIPSGDIELHRAAIDGITPLGPLATLDIEVKLSLQQTIWTGIELRLRPEQVLQRTLSLPGASRDFLGPIIEHRLERLTPWRQDKVLYGYRLVEGAVAAPGTVDVALVATSRDIVEGLVRQLSDAGFPPTRIGASEGGLDQPVPIDLQKNGAAPARGDSRRMVSRLALTTFGCLTIIALVTGTMASGAASDQDGTATKLIKARRLLKAATMANVGSREKILLDAKDPDKAMVVLIDRLAAAIPQDTFLKELAVTSDKVRLVGSSLNAPALVGQLEAAGLANVRFSAAVTREKDQRDSFEITADRAATAPETNER